MSRDESAFQCHPAHGIGTQPQSPTPAPEVAGQSQWTRNLQANPGHSQWFIERWERMKAEGKDLDGEARLVDALVPRNALIFDAGSGTGRVGGYLHERGHRVVGIDLDPTLVEYAQEHSPGPQWMVGDLAHTLHLVDPTLHGAFDLVVAAGNVVTFPAVHDRQRIMDSYASLLKPQGRFIAGFGTGRGYSLADFLEHAVAAGFASHALYSTWDLLPTTETPEYVVAVMTR